MGVSFAEPGWLLALLVLPALIAAAAWSAWRRRRNAVRLASAPMLASVAPRFGAWRRHVITAGLVVSLAVLIGASAGPSMDVSVPKERATVILAIDVSRSMAAKDVSPDRLTGAQEAAKTFLDSLPDRLNVGLVEFAGSAAITVAPTTDRAALKRGIDNLRLADSTAIGEAIFASLRAIEQSTGGDADDVPRRIVLMSDGMTTSGRPDEMAAAAARKAGIPVDTVAVGTAEGVIVLEQEPQPIPVPVGIDNLEAVADATGGDFFEARSASALDQVYRGLGSAIGFDTVHQPVTKQWVRGGVALLLVTVLASLWWFGRAV